MTAAAVESKPAASVGRVYKTVGAVPAREWVLPLLVVVIAIVVYANALRNGFVLDDEGILVHNDTIHGLSGIWRAFVTPYWPGSGGQYRPLVIASFSAEWALWHGQPAGFHAVNVLWHAATSLLVYTLLRRWLSLGGSAVGAALFAVHPVHVEAVANVVGRSELMAACGIVGMLILHARRSPWAIVVFAAALLSKEHALIAPLLALGLDVMERKPGADPGAARERRVLGMRPVVQLYAAYALVAAVWSIAVILLFRQQHFAAVAPFWMGMDASTRWLTMLGVVPVWTRLWFFPADLSVDYSPRVTEAWPDNSVFAILGAVIVVGALVYAFAVRRHSRAAVVAIAWIGVTMLPVANLLVPTGVVVAERTLYLSSIGAVMLAGLAAEWLARREMAMSLVLAAVLAATGGIRTWTRTPVWKSNRDLFLATAADHPEASWTHGSIGRVYAGNGGYPQAAAEYRMSLQLFDRNPVIWSEAILAAAKGRDFTMADSLVLEARRRAPGDYGVVMAHAFVALEQHHYSESLRAAREASAAAPDSAAPHFYAGLAWNALGVPDSARKAFERIGPGHPLRKAADSVLMTVVPGRE